MAYREQIEFWSFNENWNGT